MQSVSINDAAFPIPLYNAYLFCFAMHQLVSIGDVAFGTKPLSLPFIVALNSVLTNTDSKYP